MWGGRGDCPELTRTTPMVAQIDREVVLPGVGVWHPRLRLLESNAAMLQGSKVEQSVKRLIVHVHQPEDLQDALSSEVLSSVEELTVDYISGYSYSALKLALGTAKMEPGVIRSVKLVGQGSMKPWQAVCLQDMYRGLCGVTLTAFDEVYPPDYSTKGGRIIRSRLEDDFFLWHRGDTVSARAICISSFDRDLIAAKPRKLVVDCDDQFPIAQLGGPFVTGALDTVESLVLYNVTTTPYILIDWFNRLKLPALKSFRMTSNDLQTQPKWVKAIAVRTRHLGFKFN